MLGKRYITYLFYLNAILSITIFVPQIMYKNSLNGSILSIGLAIIVGGLFIYILKKIFVEFPEQNINQILKYVVPNWVRKWYVIYSLIFWYLTGALYIIALIQVVKLFINPQTPLMVTYFIFLALIIFTILLKTESLLYVTEVIVLLHIPIILFITARFLSDPYIFKDSIYQSVTYIKHLPKFNSFTAALFIFTGFSNLIIFNEKININFIKKRYIIGIFLFGIFILLSSYFIPIGYLGLKGVSKEVFVWLTTVDSMQFEYLFVERVIYIILYVQIFCSLIYIILCWHTSLELFKTLNLNYRGMYKWILISFFICLTTIIQLLIKEQEIIKYFIIFFNYSAISNFLLVILLIYVSIKKRHAS
ncbi:GerAB/ArcD/ProY family transporter [Bacillus sp. EAC]|uniref:GerAB/ArcD/ProY family transporter n=1 Tax=Bacillus sp. EAC TaxID=1978338 RepID=UPI0011550009|nr:GerAB/ArcD/ProY family transporter [Bacillus sp. EAC]